MAKRAMLTADGQALSSPWSGAGAWCWGPVWSGGRCGQTRQRHPRRGCCRVSSRRSLTPLLSPPKRPYTATTLGESRELRLWSRLCIRQSLRSSVRALRRDTRGPPWIGRQPHRRGVPWRACSVPLPLERISQCRRNDSSPSGGLLNDQDVPVVSLARLHVRI